MSSLRRRSSRLRSSPATPNKSLNYAPHRLSSLVERDESPMAGPQSILDSILSSPIAPQTPATAGRVVPSRDEMHPSKVQQSTAKKPDSGLRFGFVDASTAEQNSSGPLGTPSKVNVSSSFDFRFAQPALELGPEAQKLMAELRGEASRNMARLVADREEEKRKLSWEDNNTLSARKIAQPKGKAGRFSDVHMAEFKKMDSIAGHPSSFRAQNVRSTPTTAFRSLKRSQSKANLGGAEESKPIAKPLNRSQSKANLGGNPEQFMPVEKTLKRTQSKANLGGNPEQFMPVEKTLKRTQSKANLGGNPEQCMPVEKTLKRTQSKANLGDREQTSTIPKPLKRSQSKANLYNREETDLLMKPTVTPHQIDTQTGTPAKRVRREISGEELTSVGRKDTQLLDTNPATPQLYQAKSEFLHHLTTPTQSSLARAAVVKPTPSQIPSLSRSPSKPNLGTPGRLTKSVANSNLVSITRSIFRRQDKSAIPSLMKSPSKINLKKDLPRVPSTPSGQYRTQDKDIRRAIFTPASTSKHLYRDQPSSPSPVKSGIPRSKSNINMREISYPNLPDADRDDSGGVQYPSLSPTRPLPVPPKKNEPPQSVPGNFTFRSDQTISFGKSPRGFGSSPGQASVRQVRPSILPFQMPGSFPTNNKEDGENIQAVAHSTANRKRGRGEEENDKEDEEEGVERSPKKHKAQHVSEVDMLMSPKVQAKVEAEKAAPKSKIPSPAKRAVLSLSRLNMLARPKNRR